MTPQERRRPRRAEPSDSTAAPTPSATTGATTGSAATHSHDQNSMLGLSTTDLAGLTVDELFENKTAITMMLHYYRLLYDDNNSLRTEVASLQTYQTGYQRAKLLSGVAAVLLSVSNLGIGLGSSLLISGQRTLGLLTIIPGLGFLVAGLGFLLWDSFADFIRRR